MFVFPAAYVGDFLSTCDYVVYSCATSWTLSRGNDSQSETTLAFSTRDDLRSAACYRPAWTDSQRADHPDLRSGSERHLRFWNVSLAWNLSFYHSKQSIIISPFS